MPPKGARSTKRKATAKDEPQGKFLENFGGCSYAPGSRKGEQGKEGALNADKAEPVVIEDSHDILPPRVSTADERSHLRGVEPPTHRRGCRAGRGRGVHLHHAAVARVVGVAFITITLLVRRGTAGARGVAPRAPALPLAPTRPAAPVGPFIDARNFGSSFAAVSVPRANLVLSIVLSRTVAPVIEIAA